MTSFQARYCAAQRCRYDQFVHRVFWQCLHRHACLFAPILAAMRRDYFYPDRELIACAGRARTLRELNEELREFMKDYRNGTWWRQRILIRLSTHRLRRLGRRYLPVGTAGCAGTEG